MIWIGMTILYVLGAIGAYIICQAFPEENTAADIFIAIFWPFAPPLLGGIYLVHVVRQVLE